MNLLFFISISAVAVNSSRFCIECKHYIQNPNFADLAYGKCRKYPLPFVRKIDPTTGEEYYSYNPSEEFHKRFVPCLEARSNAHLCGTRGKFYEPKL